MSMIRRDFLPSVDHFTTIPNAWLRDPNMTHRARGLLVQLLSHREGWSVTVESLARAGREGKTAISRDLRELEELGYLRREQSRTESGFGAMDYVLTDPADREKSQVADATRSPVTDKSVTGESLTENVATDNVGTANVGATSVGPTNPLTKKNNQEDQPKNTNQVSSSATADSPPAGTGGKGRTPEPHREDVEALCTRLRDHIAANTDRPPNITQAWRRDARLLLDRDGIAFDEAMRVLDWCQRDPFWQSNILSMPKFRKQFAQLQIKSRQPQGGGRPNTLAAWGTPAGEDMFGTQPTTAPMDYIDAEHFQEIEQ